MAPLMESVRRAPTVRKPGGALRFGRAALLAGWVVFALTAVLSPCIEAIAAAISDHAENVTEAFAGTTVDHSLNDESVRTERGDHGFELSCYDLAGAVPWNAQVPLALTTNYTPSGWDAIEGVATRPLIVSTRSGSLAQYEIPPPARRLYLRTLRFLI